MTQAPSIKEAFVQYRRTQIAEMTPWVEGFDMRYVSVSATDASRGSPKTGDMIARNPKNHADQWLVAAQYFADNFEPLTTLQPSGERREAIARLRRSLDRWAGCSPEAISKGSEAQMAYFVADAKHDIATLASGLVQDEAGWRDISTAPKDETEILLFTHHEADEYLDESFDAVQIGWWDDGNHAPGSAFHRNAGWHQQKIGSATHWMPLPAPPIRSARNGGAES